MKHLFMQANAKFGMCDVPLLAPPPPAQLPPSAEAQPPINNSPIHRPLYIRYFISTILFVLVLLRL